MHPERAELSSVASTLEEICRRVAAAADRSTHSKDEALASGLYEVERSLQAAERRLSSVVSRLSR